MKKVLFILSAAAMLFAGCAKEALTENDGAIGGEQTVTFKVGLETSATKAVVDNDGNGAKVNHWIMEVLDEVGNRYNYQEDDGTEGTLTHTFDVRLVKGQTYNVLFWADTKGTYDVAKLTEVKLADETGYTASLDNRDAFSAVVSDFQSNGPSQNAVTLKRPLAQLNVIFTDLKALYETIGSETEYLRYKPQDFVVTAKVPTSFNVQTQTAGAPAATALTMTAANNYLNNYATHRAKETLYMDYFFATKDSKDVVDIDFAFESNGLPIAHKFTAVPFQRNYRTNVMGDLMSDKAKWNVEIDPIWTLPEFNEEIKIVSSLEDAQKAAETSSDNEVVVVANQEVVQNATTSDVVTIGGKKYLPLVLKTTSPNNIRFELPEISAEDATRLGTDTWIITYEGNYPTETVAVKAEDGAKLKIEAPTSHVQVIGTYYAEITAKTGDNTLVIPAGVTVAKLIVEKGGLEIHGTVNTVEVNVTAPDKVYVRSCEGLSQSVYDVLEPYIDAPKYEGVKVGDKWDIVEQSPSSFVTMGTKAYFRIEDAFKEVNDQEGEDVVITVHRNLDENMSADYTFQKNVLITTDNANGVNVNLNCSQTQSLISEAAKTLTVDTKVAITNLCQMFAGYGTADSKAIVKGQLYSQQIWAYKGGKFYIVPGAKVVCAYGDGMVKLRRDCSIDVQDDVESAASIDVTADTPIFSSGYISADKDGAKVLNLTNCFSKTQFLSSENTGSFTVNMDNAVFYVADDLRRGLNFGSTASGNISMVNGSRIITDGPVAITEGTVSIQAGSTITAKSFSCAGSVNIDATNATDAIIPVVSATAASSYSNITVTGENYEPAVENNCLYIKRVQYTDVATESALKTAIANGENVKLTANITMTSYLAINNALKIDLNGKELSTGTMDGNKKDTDESCYRPIRIGAIVTIKDGQINGPSMEYGNGIINVLDNGNLTLSNVSMNTTGVCATSRTSTSVLTIESGTYTSTGTTSTVADFSYCTPVAIMNAGLANIKGGTFTGTYYAAAIWSSGGTINVTGGTFNKGAKQTDAKEGNLAYAFMNDGNNTTAQQGTINISGNPIIHGSFRGRFNNQAGHYGYLNISGGTFDDDCELFNFNQDKITLDGYTITANGECPDKGFSSTTGNGKRWTLTKD